MAQWLRKKTLIKKGETTEITDPKKKNAEINKIILVANKAEYDFDNDIYDDIYKLGFGDPIFISAEQGDGMVAKIFFFLFCKSNFIFNVQMFFSFKPYFFTQIINY